MLKGKNNQAQQSSLRGAAGAEAITILKRDCFVGLQPPRNDESRGGLNLPYGRAMAKEAGLLAMMHHFVIARPRSGRSNHAFTLIELVVAVTIFSIVAVGIASSFFSGMKLWEKAKEDIADSALPLSVEAIARELRQSGNATAIGFEGGAVDISFPLVTGNNILKVTYKFDSSQNCLMRGELPLKDVINETMAGQEYREKSVLQLDDFTLSYFYLDNTTEKYLWKDNWVKDDGVFSAVKLHGREKNLEFEKTVFIPES